MPGYLYRPLPAKSASSVSATLAVINVIVAIIGRTTVLAYIATLNIVRIILSSYRDVSAVGRALQYIQPEGQLLSSRYVRTVATLREKRGDYPGARGASAALPIRYRYKSLL